MVEDIGESNTESGRIGGVGGNVTRGVGFWVDGRGEYIGRSVLPPSAKVKSVDIDGREHLALSSTGGDGGGTGGGCEVKPPCCC